uniref:RNA-dependent RNA polymerase n=1 Tax=Tonghua Narna tick virus 1 TaxID=2972228 RepID=A0A9E8A9D7_9VIRU|nr:MAG: RNA-dependent RNA polymerase [Tonghua Narna tick virus 1]
MVVFSHNCLPLTSNLKGLRGSIDKSNENTGGEEQLFHWERLVRRLVRAVRLGDPGKDPITWTYEFDSLWSPKLRDSRGRRINFYRSSQETIICLLSSRTYWYKRLPKAQQQKVKNLCSDTKGRRFLRDCLHTADGVLVSLLFGFPELFLNGYEYSDQITNSILCNCFHNYSSFQTDLKKLRKTFRRAAFSKERVTLNYDMLRSMSYMVRPLQILNEYAGRSSKEKMFRVGMFCQTRSTGLAGADQVKSSVEEFIQGVTTPGVFAPNELLTDSISQVVKAIAAQPTFGTNPEFKISMSTSACRESSKKNEGKFGYLKTLVRGCSKVIPPLREGISGTLGNWLWPEAQQRLREDPEDVLSVNVAAVRENGKARVVTSGSFWKDVALQPFSHITLHAIKTFDNLKSSLQAAKLGWKFISEIEYEYDGIGKYNWIFDTPGVCLYTSDWKRATDGPTPESGWALSGKLFKDMGLGPTELETIKSYWLGRKKLFYKGQHVGWLVRGIPMGDPITKTNLCLAHVVCDLYAKAKTGCLSHERGNGDDTAAFCSSPEYAKYHLEAAEMLGYERSPEDDVVTSDWGTYAEEYFYKPVSKVNTCRWAMRRGKQDLLPYLDLPKGRIMIGTTKDRVDFSSDPRGKVSLMGHEEEYAMRLDGPGNTIFSIASAIQDVHLSTLDYQTPLFLPRQVFGVGKAVPGWDVQSYLNMLERTEPWKKALYLRSMAELVGREPVLVTDLRGALKESNHFDGEMMVEVTTIPKSDPVRKHIAVLADDYDKYPMGSLQKLVSLGMLVPESKLTKYYLFQERLTSLEQDLKKDLFEVVKARMATSDAEIFGSPREIVEEFCMLFSKRPYLLKGGRAENLYYLDAVKTLEEGNPLRVTNLEFPMLDKFHRRLPPSGRYEEEGVKLFEWFVDNKYFIESEEEFDLPPQAILEDDPIILQSIQNCEYADIFFIVTDDIKLVRKARKLANGYVGRISCYDYLRSVKPDADRSFNTTDHIEYFFEQLYQKPVSIEIDLGSLDTCIRSYQVDSHGFYRAVGIPWREDISVKNIKREPHTATTEFSYHTLDQMGYPWKAYRLPGDTSKSIYNTGPSGLKRAKG